MTHRFIHRLDYATSGALCVATSPHGARWGHKAFEKRHVTKHYLALVSTRHCSYFLKVVRKSYTSSNQFVSCKGIVPNISEFLIFFQVRGEVSLEACDGITINIPIGQDMSSVDTIKMTTPDNPNCVHARNASSTIYLLEHGIYEGKPASKVLLVPHTGNAYFVETS